MQRVVGIALGYADLNDHGRLRHDPILAVLAGKLASARANGGRGGGTGPHHPLDPVRWSRVCILLRGDAGARWADSGGSQPGQSIRPWAQRNQTGKRQIGDRREECRLGRLETGPRSAGRKGSTGRRQRTDSPLD